MKVSLKSVLIALAILVGVCAILLVVHMSVNHLNFVGLIRSMHGKR